MGRVVERPIHNSEILYMYVVDHVYHLNETGKATISIWLVEDESRNFANEIKNQFEMQQLLSQYVN
jgi:hypothetical protein